ncbi:GNAT family N-acetyltransferase [Halosimplex rubrum]|uniref:GNAT family N-acetyltransferase n=1 Tax=Halosimplex rubrum TaxID=869889 RepID=A0A7D5T524_9EURY|nr:GNAT family N-acetyltransferase [Halosimplex rubrum]QLH78210.1 GNAT family N-acetyltransferase [Halosimplex rubrum]
MTDGTRVREGRSADLAALRAIQAAVLAEPWEELLTVAADGPPLLLVATPASPDAGAGAGPSPVGYALAVTDGDDDAGYLAELAVAPDRQGEGHGSALLDALVARLRESGVGKLRVTVREVDEAARAFYRERGFERRERLPDRYERGDGFLLVRELGE